MSTRSLIVAAVSATAMLGACTSAAPTGAEARPLPSFDFSNSGDSSHASAGSDTLSHVTSDSTAQCPPPADTTPRIAATYAVAYGAPPVSPPECTTSP